MAKDDNMSGPTKETMEKTFAGGSIVGMTPNGTETFPAEKLSIVAKTVSGKDDKSGTDDFKGDNLNKCGS